MRFAIRITAFLVLLFTTVHADELSDISRELDFLESSFITAAEMDKASENYREVEKRLLTFHARLSRLQQKLTSNRTPGAPSFVRYSIELKGVYSNIGRRSRKEKRVPRLKRTGMGEYTKVFLRNLRNQNKGKRKDMPRYATLKNIRLDSYCAWLDEIAQSNIDMIRNRSSLSPLRQKYLETYVINIVALRKCTAMLAKNPNYKD